MIEEFVLHDVRCFQGEQRAKLGPITLLVGENSTGKTTFLGCYSVLHRLISRAAMSGDPMDFNQEPFSMGSFREIARSGRGRTGRIEQFKLGCSIAPMPSAGVRSYPLLVTFSEEGSQPIVTSIHIQFKEQVFLNIQRSSSGGTILAIPESKVAIDYSIDNWMYLLDHLLRPNGHLVESRGCSGDDRIAFRAASAEEEPGRLATMASGYSTGRTHSTASVEAPSVPMTRCVRLPRRMVSMSRC